MTNYFCLTAQGMKPSDRSPLGLESAGDDLSILGKPFDHQLS